MTISSALESLDAYSQFVVETLNRPSVERSTVVVWSNSRYTGVAEGADSLLHMAMKGTEPMKSSIGTMTFLIPRIQP